MVTIPLTEENVREIQKDYIDVKDLEVIISKGFFGFTRGSFTVHRDKYGRLSNIEKRFMEQIRTMYNM